MTALVAIDALPALGAISGKPASRYTGVARTPLPGRLAAYDTRGTIAANNRVMVKPDPSSPEIPYAGARVRLHHLLTGRLDWQGISDTQGYYHATGLTVDDWYYPVAIDLTGTYECDAAGPVQAVRAA